MTDYYGAFSTSTSNFLGKIQLTNIDTSYKSVLTCLSNNEKKSKKLSEQNAPPSLLSQPPSWGWVMGSRSGPTLSGPPARGSSNALLLQCLYIWGKKPHLLHYGSISFTLVLVPSLFRSSAVVNVHFFVSKVSKRVELVLFLVFLNLKLFTAWIFW